MYMPNTPPGYNPNVRPNQTQVIFTNGFGTDGVLDSSLASATVTQGMFVSKKNVTPNSNLFVLPTAASVAVGNLWIITGGTQPDALGVSNVDGTVGAVAAQVLPAFGAGYSIKVIPFPQNGTVAQLQLKINSGDTVAVNSPLYINALGQATPDAGTALTTEYSIGYVGAILDNTISATAIYPAVCVLMWNSSIGALAAALAAAPLVLASGSVPALLPAAEVLTAGSGMTVTPGSGVVTIATPLAASLAAAPIVLGSGSVPAFLTAGEVLTAGANVTVTPGSGIVTVAST